VTQQLTRDSPAAERAPVIVERLIEQYGAEPVPLDHSNAFELLVATILSAQSTDKKINEVTAQLFRRYRRPADYLAVPEEQLQDDLRPTGFFRQKAKALRGMSQALLDHFNGQVPLRIADLVTLPGVARKTANVVLSQWAPALHETDPDAGIAVDTHVRRLARRFGFTVSGDADKIERDLMALLPRSQWAESSLAIIYHGRRVCDAQRPRCTACLVEPLCPSSLAAGRTDLAGQAKRLGTP
jgi:endonuclease-3